MTDPNAQPQPVPPPYGPQPVPVYVVPQQPPRSGLATASLVLGIIGVATFFCTLGFFSLFAIVFGHAARSETKRGEKSGDSTAKTGLTLGYIGIVPAAVVLILRAAGIRP